MRLALLRVEFRRFFSLPWNLRLVVLAVPATVLSLWEFTPSPFIPIFAALFIGLEPLFCNILFRTPNEFEALSILPIRWADVILAKNLAAICITLICLPIMSILVIYFSPHLLTAHDLRIAGLYLASVIFPLLHMGNLQSLQHPRRHQGWRMDDLAGGLLMAVFVAVVSVPFFLLVIVAGSPWSGIFYSGVTGYLWYRQSIKRTAHRITHSMSDLCTVQ